MANSVYTIKDLAFSYPGHPVFEGLELIIREGAVTTLIGANGSGKSTLFNLMTRQLAPQRGAVFLRRGNVAMIGQRQLAQLVAIVHQHNTAPADLSVGKLVSYGREPYHAIGQVQRTEDDDRMVAWALEVSGLRGLEGRPVSALSGGQKQRAWIAMALAQGTRVLLLDEPTTYLDVRYQLDTLKLVRRLNREFGITVVMILHDINQSLHYSDEIVALADGQVVAQGAPEHIVSPDLVRRVYGVDLRVVQVEGKPFVLAV